MSITPAVREASRAKDYGKVIELVRRGARLTQTQLGQVCGLSQSAVSRLEKRGPGAYATDVLAVMAAHLGVPASLLGLADAAVRDGYEDMRRRNFIGGFAAAAVATALPALPDPGEGVGQAATLRLGTASYRRLDGATPSRDLSAAVQSHLRLVQAVSRAAGDDRQRARASRLSGVRRRACWAGCRGTWAITVQRAAGTPQRSRRRGLRGIPCWLPTRPGAWPSSRRTPGTGCRP